MPIEEILAYADDIACYSLEYATKKILDFLINDLLYIKNQLNYINYLMKKRKVK